MLPKKSCQHVNLETELFSNSVSKQTLKQKKNKTITTTPSLTQKNEKKYFKGFNNRKEERKQQAQF